MTILQPTHQALGLDSYRNIDLGVTGQIVKAGPGQLYGYYYDNVALDVRVLKFYDQPTTPTHTDTPKLSIRLPASSAANIFTCIGVTFYAGISVRATTGIEDNDTGAPTAHDVVVNVYYK